MAGAGTAHRRGPCIGRRGAGGRGCSHGGGGGRGRGRDRAGLCGRVGGNRGLTMDPAVPCGSAPTGLTGSGGPSMLREARLGRGASLATG